MSPASPWSSISVDGRKGPQSGRQIRFLVVGRRRGGGEFLSFAELDLGGGLRRSCSEVAAAGERAILLFPPGLEFLQALFGRLAAGSGCRPGRDPAAEPAESAARGDRRELGG